MTSAASVNWSDYQAFLAIARAGQLAAGARTLGVDPTTLGRRLRRLEAALGTRLFENTRTGQELTEAGEALLVSVEVMAGAAGRIADDAQTGEGLHGTLRISTSEGFGSWFLAERLPQFQAENPRLAIDLVANSGFLSPSRREADVAIMLSRPSSGPLVAHKLADYALRLYASRAYLAQRGMPQKPSELADAHTLVGYVPDLLYAPELRYLDEVHAGLKAHIRSSSITAQMQVVKTGMALGVLPCFMAAREPDLVEVLPQSTVKRSLWFVTHQDIRTALRVSMFRQWLDGIVARSKFVLEPAPA